MSTEDRPNPVPEPCQTPDLVAFLDMVTHDFRNTLTVIQLSSDILQRYENRLSATQHNEHQTRIQHAIQHLYLIVDDMLLILGVSGVEHEIHLLTSGDDLFYERLMQTIFADVPERMMQLGLEWHRVNPSAACGWYHRPTG